MSRELFPEEEDKLTRIENIVEEILRALHGEPMYKQKGLLDNYESFKMETALQLKSMEVRLATLESNKKTWMFGIICFGVGVFIAFAIYFGLSLKEIKNFIQ
jgi:hypothetical protein